MYLQAPLSYSIFGGAVVTTNIRGVVYRLMPDENFPNVFAMMNDESAENTWDMLRLVLYRYEIFSCVPPA
jgi:hypothetical protein